MYSKKIVSNDNYEQFFHKFINYYGTVPTCDKIFCLKKQNLKLIIKNIYSFKSSIL